MNIKTGLIADIIVVGGAAVIAAGCLGPTIIEKLNENEESKMKRIRNIVGVYAGCFTLGCTIGTLSETNHNQIIFTETSKEILKSCEEAAKAVL